MGKGKKRGSQPKKSTAKFFATIIGVIGIAVIVGAVFMTLSNSQASSSVGGRNLTVAPGTVVVEGLEVGQLAPDFRLIDPLKGPISKATFHGKPLVIFFTTTWCTPCQIGAQNLARYDDETGGNAFNVLIVFVDPRETESQFLDWKNKYGREDWYVAAGVDMVAQYKVRYLDTKYVLDKDGIIRWVDVYPLEYSKIKQVLAPLLTQK
ncbi:Thiol-disulfide oxidoreductase ResA [Candidatus Calditenuaceae archaeon HR02]|nr:Thiol-disulfide oxidoreductase ResA [Candidatus Calditenuaceae archaeon HR02]